MFSSRAVNGLRLFVLSFLLLLSTGSRAHAQSGSVLVTTNTTWATGTYNLTSLTVQGGAVLTIGGGSSVTVSGATLVTGSSSIVFQSINNSAQVNGQWAGAGVTLNSASLEVDAGSTINADGQGYVAGAGPGGINSSVSSGGSYGGVGGTGNGTTAAGIYGSTTSPTDLGSGGSARCCGAIPGAGGGAVILSVSGTLLNNGTISANGVNDTVSVQGGGGSGGSVYVTTGGLTGSGVFTTTGGSGGEAGGGGGRIAVYYNGSSSSFSGFTGSTATGGGCSNQCNSGNTAGANGTGAFFDTSASNNNLTVYQGFVIPASTTVSYNSITVNAGALLTIGGGSSVTLANVLTVSGTVVAQSIKNAVQVNGTWQGTGVTLNAASVVVNTNGSINGDAQGYLAGTGPGAVPGAFSPGGSYGGVGGTGNGQAAAPVYGSTTAPVDLGSGGSARCCGAIPGTGGGALILTISGTLTNNGIISANGGSYSTAIQAGGGSGGTVSIHTGTITGSGSIAANGGLGGEAGGGGGRVALFYTTNNGFNLNQATANAGAASGGNAGSPGTVYILTSSSNLNVTGNTALPANAILAYDAVTVSNQGTLTLGSGSTLTANSITLSTAGTFTVGGGSTVTVKGPVMVTGNSNIILQSLNNSSQINGKWAGAGVAFNAASVQVDQGSSINADGQGYVAGAGPGAVAGSGGAGSSAGGSYGGVGGTGNGFAGAAVYGSTTAPVDLGSGGAGFCCGVIPGAGGGALTLTVSGNLTNNGIISANGSVDTASVQGGGGSGGSLYVTTGGLVGSGVFTTTGGGGGQAGGGGGRIAIYFNAPQSSFTGFASSTANPGGCGSNCSNGTASAGSVGTVAFYDTSATNNNLFVYQNQTIPAGSTVNYNSITVQPSALLTIGGGATVNLASALTVSGTVVAQSANNTTQVGGVWAGTGVSIKSASIVINQAGSLNSDGQGYVAGAGPGSIPGAGSNGSSAGGSYGGVGGTGNGFAGAPVYGSTTSPIDLGSGGAAFCCGALPGAGGGALTLSVSGTLTNNGTISANGGASSVNIQAGGGSGGSLYVTTSGLAGSGVFTTNGGAGAQASGGGGRIAIYYNGPMSSFANFVGSTATGGVCSACSNGTTSTGGTGTVAFFDNSAANDNLMVDQDLTIPAGATVTYNSITVQNNAILTIGGGATVNVGNMTVSGTVIAQSINNSAQVNGTWRGTGVTLNATSLLVNANGNINADGQGYVAGAGPGGTAGSFSPGGSYGGVGGTGNGTAAAAAYGSTTAPTDLGSGGQARCCGAIPGAGGGALLITITGTLTNNGSISSNGSPETSGNPQAGGGSGGTVSVHTNGLSGSGVFTVNGGSGGEAGGGGGRLVIYYNGPSSNFTGFAGSTASGGGCSNQCNNGNTAGGNGTAAFFDTSATNNNVSVYQNFVIPASTTASYNNLTIQPGALLTIGGGATVNVANTLTASGTVVAQSLNNTAQVNGTWQGAGVTINSAAVLVNTNGSINADTLGYVAGAGPGTTAGSFSPGGSYGGVGGTGNGQTAAPAYGSTTTPVDLGSGGQARCCGAIPGAGGGALTFVISGTLTDNGIISANGGNDSVASQGGGGSGGTVLIHAQTISGSGSIAANGGTGGEGGGGGGRVALYYTANSGLSLTQITAAGGAASQGNPGAAGTVYVLDSNSNLNVSGNAVLPANANLTYANVVVANQGTFTLGSGTTMTATNVNVSAAGTFAVGGGSTITVNGPIVVTGNSNVIFQGLNNAGQINGVWAGVGSTMIASSVQVDAGSTINADYQGYAANSGPGGAPGGSSAGGSYGGSGGTGDAGVSAAATYGSTKQPSDLGSGGSSRCCGAVPGVGGGAMRLIISGTLTDNGVISANGQSVASVGAQAGGGSGGSIFLVTGQLAGTGSIQANGGAAGEAGGGGGRIAVYYLASNGFNTSLITAAGGPNGNPGAAGTLNIINGPTSVFLQPTKSVLHGTATVQWFSDIGGPSTVTLAGPRTATVATSTADLTTSTFDTTTVPDGTYQLVLSVQNTAGQTAEQITDNVVINNSVAWHSGTLTASQTWGPTPVQALDGNVIVPSGVTLTIVPGTVVKALAGAQIIVQSGGMLIATGSTNLPVTFTTFDDFSIGGNTDFNQGISLPSPGEWNGIAVLGGATFTSNTSTIIRYAQSNLAGTLGASTTLYATQAYTISGTLVVPAGLTLSVQPGTVVKMESGAGIDVQTGGIFSANGTLAQPIYITSINDNSVGANILGTSTAPAPGDWNSILIDGGTATFNYVQVQYGGGPIPSNGQEGMIETSGNANVTVSNSTLAFSYYIGIQTGLNAGGDTVTVTNSVFYNNEDRAMNIYPGTTAHIVNSTFDGNSAGVFNHGGSVDVENSVVTNSLSTQFGGIGICCGGAFTSLKNNNVFNTMANVPTYIGITDPTGTAGNISANPVYMNQPVHDYRPTYGSPLIDAGNGTIPNYPLTDSFNQPRYNAPLVTTKTGTPDVNGKYPDIGAFEFVQSAPSDLDMTVVNVQGPSSAIVGNQATVTWTITNVGQGTIYGPWYDGVYLVRDAGTNPVATLAGQFLEGQNTILGPGATYSGTATVTLPGAITGEYNWEVKTNVRGQIFEGVNTANNTANSLGTVSVDVPSLTAGTGPTNGTLTGTGASAYYKVTPSAGQATSVQVALTSNTGSVQVFVGAGYIPTPQQYDYQQVEFNSTTASLVIPSGSAQTYYVTVYGQSLPSGAGPFTIQASLVKFSLISVSPASVPMLGPATITFVGGGFTSGTTFQLVGGGNTYFPTAVFLTDADHAELTFSTSSIPTASYTAQAINGSTVSLANAVTFTAPSNAAIFDQLLNTNIQVSLQTPEAFRAGFPSIVTLTYTNVGGTDVPAPLIYLNATNATLAEIPATCTGCNANFPLQYQKTYASGLVLGINHQGPAGILPAGATGSVQFTATPTSTATVYFDAEAATNDLIATRNYLAYDICGGVNDCIFQQAQSGAYAQASSYCASAAPIGINPAGFTRACMLLLNHSGYSYTTPVYTGTANNSLVTGPYSLINVYELGHVSLSGFNGMLASNATQLSAQGTYEYDAQKLLSLELNKDGLGDFNRRYHQGAFGYGPSHPFDITGDSAAGSPTIHYSDGTTRAFTVVSPTQSNVFLSTVGDYGTLTVAADNTWTVNESDGTVYHFAVIGTNHALDYFADRDGNKTTLTYSGNQVTGVADAFGRTLAFQYDSLGHISQITDYQGRVTTLGYATLNDSVHSTFLTTINNSKGTTSITWNEGGSHGVGYLDDTCIASFCEAAIGINQIAFFDGTHEYFQYDAAGRLIAENGDNGVQPLYFTYNSDGSVTTTDGAGDATKTTPNEAGLPSIFADPLGNITHFHYDPENKLNVAIGALGDSATASYDMLGNLATVTTPKGSLTSLAYAPDQSPTSLTDANGNEVTFGYNNNYDLTTYSAPDGTSIKRTFDSQGHPVTRTNARGNTITLAYGTHGLLTSKTYTNGTQYTYTYDGHDNLLTATTPAGVTRYTYDSADRLLSLTNPDGTSLQYTYNAQGLRGSMTDSVGFVTNYLYDSAGRLSSLTNSSGATIVSYTYDSVGRLSTKTLGNGTSTTLTYDANGNPLNVVNHGAGNSALSEYDYTYDAEGRPLTLSAPSGKTTFTYDLEGQLISAATPAATIQYNYDSAGNRTSYTSASGTTNYQTNNLNQYTKAGATPYQYDLDGNLIAGNGYTYTYDDEDHMLTMVSSSDSWSFGYDGQGRRISSTHNGAVTHYLIDPAGNGNIEAEFNGSGQATAHYMYGLDLTSSVQSSGTTSYYHFDGVGNTTQITGSTGAVINSYVYLPFGEKSVISSGVANPFTYSGQLGVRDEGSGLYFMRNRFYNPTLGRFQTQDPTQFVGGLNQYEYAANSPLRNNDPNGLFPLDYVTGSIGVGIIIGVQVNVHTGETFLSLGVSPGAGANVAGGYISPSATTSNRGQATSDFLGGLSYNASIYDGAGGGVTGNGQGDASVEFGAGIGGHGGSANYAVSTNNEDLQTSITWVNNVTGGYLFGNPPQNVLTNPNHPVPPVCGTCITKPGQPKPVPVGTPIDPNGKLTSGYGNSGFVPAGAPITYTIYFENQPTATLPAQKVTVTDPLPANLDWSTLQLNQINFNNATLTLPSGTQTYTGQANVSTDPNPVAVAASLNPATGVLTFTMQSVDPVTGGSPANPLSGFLPPNNAANQGIGSVVFTVTPKASLTNGATITNQGSIIFDVNAAIATNTVTNTIDTSTVTSAIAPMAATSASVSIPVSWSGSDASGSGISTYNIYVSTDSGSYVLWLSATSLTTSNYTGGAVGHSYSFISLATNNVGINQTTPGAAQTVTITLPTPIVTVTPAASTITASQSLSVGITVAAPAGSTTSVPTGSVTLASGSYTSASVTLTSGAATIIIPAGALAGGADSLTATYTPDTTSSTIFTAATGSAGVTVSGSGTPTNVQVSVGTSPIGQVFTIDGVSFTSAQTLTWVVGSTHTLATTSPQISGGVQTTFTAWSDAGAISHSVTAPATSTTYTANFSTAYLLMTTAAPTAGGTITPATGSYYPAGTVVSLTATPTSGYNFTSWTGAVASASSASTTVTMTGPQAVTANFSIVTAPAITLNPAALSFTTVLGTPSAVQTVQVTNHGTAALTISSVSITGASSFTQTNACVGGLAVNATCMISVTFSPATATSYSASLLIADNATGSPQTIALTGTATAPALVTPTVTVTPASVSVVASQTLSVTVAVASASLTLPTGTVILTSGTYSSAATTLVNGTAAIVIPAGSLATGADSLVAAYTPGTGATGIFAGGSGMANVTVTAASAQVTLTPTTLTFTSPSGVTTAAQSVQLTNNGSAALSISGVTLTGANATSFAQTNNCGTSVAVGGSCTIAVTFAPAATGSFSASVNIADSASSSPQSIALTGTGTAGATFTLTATPASQTVNYGSAAGYTIKLTPQNGTFSNAVTLTASGLPAGATATFAPSTLVPGTAGASSTFTVQTTKPLFASLPADRSIAKPVLALAGLLLLATRRRRRLLYPLLVFAALAVLSLTTSGCGSAASTSSSTITITATSGSQVQTTTVTLSLH